MIYYKTYDEYAAASRRKAARWEAIRAAPSGSVWQQGDYLIAKASHHDSEVAHALRALEFEWSRSERVWLWTAWTVKPGEGYVDHKLVMRPNLDVVRQVALHKAGAILARHTSSKGAL